MKELRLYEEDDPIKGKGDEAHRERRRTELWLLSSKTWRAFNLTCQDYCNWTISHIELYDDFRARVHEAIFNRGSESMAEVRALTTVCELFTNGHYFEGCKKLKVL